MTVVMQWIWQWYVCICFALGEIEVREMNQSIENLFICGTPVSVLHFETSQRSAV